MNEIGEGLDRPSVTGRTIRTFVAIAGVGLATAIWSPVATGADFSAPFTADAEGWTVTQNPVEANGTTEPPTWLGTGGNPSGHIRVTDSVPGRGFFLNSPPGWGGNQSSNAGGRLSADIIHVSGGAPASRAFFRLEATNGSRITGFLYGGVPTTQWKTFVVPLKPGPGMNHVSSIGAISEPPTEEQFASVLGSLARVRISAETSGEAGSTAGIDNIIFSSSPAPDADGDGIPDSADLCPGQLEDGREGFGAKLDDGCPDLDFDGDGVENDLDSCPQLASAEPDGCPVIARDLTIKYAKKNGLFKGRLGADANCISGNQVEVFRKRKGRDSAIGASFTNDRGIYKVRESDPKRGSYYAAVAEEVRSDVGRCAAATSEDLKIR